MAEERPWKVQFQNYKGPMTLTLTLDWVIQHTIVHQSSTSIYTPDFIEIGKTFCGQTDVWMYLLMDRPLDRLGGVDLKITIIGLQWNTVRLLWDMADWPASPVLPALNSCSTTRQGDWPVYDQTAHLLDPTLEISDQTCNKNNQSIKETKQIYKSPQATSKSKALHGNHNASRCLIYLMASQVGV